MKPMHNLLQRQLDRYFSDPNSIAVELQDFITAIDDAYRQFDSDRKMLERSLDLSSQELLQANSDMRAVFQVIPDLFFRLDASGTILDYKAGGQTDFYAPPRSLLGKRIQNIPVPEVAAEFERAISRMKSDKTQGNLEYSLLIQQQRVYYEARLLPLLENEIIAIIRDITERKHAEQALKESEEKHRNLVERASDGIAILQDSLLKFVNPRLTEMVGYTAGEALGKPFIEFIHEDQRRAIMGRYKLRMSGKAIETEYQATLNRKDGGMVDVELNVGLITYEGKSAEMVIIRDITERKKAQKALQESEEKYRRLVENANEGIFIVRDDALKFVNRKLIEICGYTEDELSSKPFLDLIHANDRASVIYHHTQRLDNDSSETVHEFRIIDKAGETKWVQLNSVLIPWQEQPAILGFMTDVSEHHRNRQQLIQSDKLAAIGTLAAGVAHELNNPISYVNSNLNTMAKYLQNIEAYLKQLGIGSDKEFEAIMEKTADFKDAITESIEGTNRVKKIVADLKSFSRVDRAEKEHANLNEGIESTLNIVWNELKYKCKVEKELGELPDLFCIPNQLNQVFLNLLVNAGHAITGSVGLIKIKTWADQGKIYISIKDNGCGIPDENIKKIFEPFFTTKDVGKGTGLGLSLVYDIIQKHKGNIEVKSQVGKGSEFIVTLPLEGVDDDKKDDSYSR